jgi:predicted MFS family arabinose efflux permease
MPRSMPASTPPAPIASALTRSRRATRLLFAALGIAAGGWGAHVPSVKTRYGLDESSLSLVLLAAALGAVAALFIAGRLVSRFGVRRCAFSSALGLGLSLAAALHAPGWTALLTLMLVLGASMSVFDVAINAEGTVIESLGGRAVMGNLHAFFSVGGMVGAAIASGLFALGVAASLQMALFGAAAPLLSGLAAPRLLAEHPSASQSGLAYRLPLLRGLVWLVGLLTLAGMVAEGAIYDWCVLYLAQELHWPPALAALGFAVFSGAMAAARFGVDRMRMRWPEGRVLGAGAALAGTAMALLLWVANPWFALIGYALVGVGLAPVVPILYTAATRIPGVSRASGIAAVSAIGYAGFMIGPPLIGALAHASSLTAALGVIVLACLMLALFSRRIP